MVAIHLPDRTLIVLNGEDIEHFLQNLITTDLEKIGVGEAWPSALLTPQGKILFGFLITRHDDSFTIETNTIDAASLVQRLMMYKLRAKVNIELSNDDGVTILYDETAPQGALIDERFKKAGTTVFRLAGHHQSSDTDITPYTALRVRYGVGEMHTDYKQQDAFPHDLLFDTNGALSFKKGCYVGQEVVSRMQHRGTARRRLVQVKSIEDLPNTTSILQASGKPVGALGSVVGNKAMAIVRIDRVSSSLAKFDPVTIGDVPVTISPYGWSGVTLQPAPDEGDK